MYTYNNRPLKQGHSWTDDNGVTHPKNWHVWSDEYKAEMGIVYTAPSEPQSPPLDEIKTVAIETAKKYANLLLSQSDWKIIRELEGRKPAEPTVRSDRNAIREACDAYEAAVLACATEQEVYALNPVWPV